MHVSRIWPAILVLALLLVAPLALARDSATAIPSAAQQALEKQYPNGKFERLAENDINGVKYASYRVTTDKGETRAEVTDSGDIISAGFPGVTTQNLPQPLQELTGAMFSAAPQRVSRTDYTTYLVNVDVDRRRYQVDIDPLGRISDVRSPTELALEDPSRLEKASDREVESLQPRLHQFFQNPQVTNVYRWPGAPNFFLVQLSSSKEKDIRLVMNPQGNIAYWRVGMSEADLPKAVSDTLRNYFKNAKVLSVYRNNQILYAVVEPSGRNEVLTFHFNAAGDIHDVIRHSAAERGEPGRGAREEPGARQ